MEVDGAEFGELVRDLQEHGLLQPIGLHEGQVLDGRNRLRACRPAGVEPRFEEWSGESPTAYVLSLNRLAATACRWRPRREAVRRTRRSSSRPPRATNCPH